MKIDEYLTLKGEKSLQKAGSHTTLLTHKNCPDGAAAAVIIKNINPSANVIHTTHERINSESLQMVEKMPEMSQLIIADISPGKNVLEKLIEAVGKKDGFLGIYDHHETTKWLAEVETKDFPHVEIIFDKDRCGSKIVYERFLQDHPELKKYHDFIQITNDRDLWIRKDPRSYHLSLLHKILSDQKYVKRFIKNPNFEGNDEEMIKIKFFEELQKKHEQAILKHIKIKKDKKGFRYGVIYGEADGSTLLNNAIEEHNLEYALLVNLNSQKVSIRGRGNMNCATYASAWGGGGHKKASGFRIKFDIPEF